MKLSAFKVSLVYTDGASIDITDTILEVSITENIFGNLEGSINIVDGVGILDNAISNDNVIVLEFNYLNTTVKHSFFLDGVNAIDITTHLTKKTYVISLKSLDTLADTLQVISKSFKGTSSDIIKTIFDDVFSHNLKVLSDSITRGHYISPNISPSKIIKQIKSQAYDIKLTPFFLFERLIDNKNTFLTSLTQVDSQPVLATISPVIQNGDTRNKPLSNIGQPKSIVIHSDNDNITYKAANGIFGKTIVNMDISKSSITTEAYGDATESNSTLNLIRLDMYDNDKAPLLNRDDHINVCEMVTKLNILFSTRITAYNCEAIPNIGVGNKIELMLNKQKQKQSPSGKFSGNYIISKIIHRIEDNDYTQTIELARG